LTLRGSATAGIGSKAAALAAAVRARKLRRDIPRRIII
jgi:hypothetical protein